MEQEMGPAVGLMGQRSPNRDAAEALNAIAPSSAKIQNHLHYQVLL